MRNALFIPLSWLYALIVRIRHFLFDKHLLVTHTLDVPTICVGNLAVGGTGKTPMVEYLLRLLLAHGYRPAVLSRGYKRKTHGFVMADAHASVQTIGDEPMQVHRAFPDVPVAVCENRVRGVRQLQRQVKDLDVVVLDDAMQHRAIRCGYTVLLTAYDNLYIDDHMLPWGRLRDLPSRALKADAIVVTKCPDTIRPIDMRVVDNRLHLPTYQHLHFAGIEYAPIEQEGTPLVVCGIAQPQYLLTHIQSHYTHAQMISFPDHHTFTPQEIEQIVQQAKHFDFVLTTVKDMQRLQQTDLEQQLAQQSKPLITLPIRMRFCTPHEDFDRFILNYVSENTRKLAITNHQ
ncbi:MAG: tetraacyldisaccharide 4'-kinase [Paludibacteraceae bacterium]|nr:tetraacyldisaccharide 4'-kinase [Paludibacteraceae bacterium]